MPQIKFYEHKKNCHFLMCICLEPTKTIFPDTNNTQTISRKQKTTSHPSFLYLCIRQRAEKITALEKPWVEGTLIFLDTIRYLRCAHPQKFDPSETGFELNLSKKNTVEEFILAPFFFFILSKKITPPFFRYQPPESH